MLPYLDIDQSYSEEDEHIAEYPVGGYIGLSVESAEKQVKEDGYKCKIIGSGESVLRQVPKAGEGLAQSSTVVLYTDEVTSGLVTVPNVVGMTAYLANKTLVDAGLNISIAGTGAGYLESAVSIAQSIEHGEVVDRGTVVLVEFRHFSNITD